MYTTRELGSEVKQMLRTSRDFFKENQKYALFFTSSFASFPDTFIAVTFDKQTISLQESLLLYNHYATFVVPTIYYVGVATDFLVLYGTVRAAVRVRKFLRRKSEELFLFMCEQSMPM